MHLWEDNYLMEIVDPETMEPLPDGEWGELILTTLDRHAMPLLRYRTQDLTRIIPGTCPCGRTARRIDRIRGRSDDMFIIKGCNVFPIQIERVLMQIPQLGNDYLITLDRQNTSDTMLLQCELKQEAFTDEYITLERLQRKVASAIHAEINVTPTVQLVAPNTLPKSTGKAVRVKDLRKNY
jgi:phenylacetate-CoA ligase